MFLAGGEGGELEPLAGCWTCLQLDRSIGEENSANAKGDYNSTSKRKIEVVSPTFVSYRERKDARGRRV